MPKFSQEDEQISDGVNLLISILVRYPEIGTISFVPENNSLRLTFMLSGVLNNSEFTSLQKLILNSIIAYHSLEGISTNLNNVQLGTYDKVSLITIHRDVDTISKGEINLTIAILRDQFNERLVTDHNEGLLEEDLVVQEELIDDMLQSIKKQHSAHGLIGIREDGRVLVFNK